MTFTQDCLLFSVLRLYFETIFSVDFSPYSISMIAGVSGKSFGVGDKTYIDTSRSCCFRLLEYSSHVLSRIRCVRKYTFQQHPDQERLLGERSSPLLPDDAGVGNGDGCVAIGPVTLPKIDARHTSGISSLDSEQCKSERLYLFESVNFACAISTHGKSISPRYWTCRFV